MVVVTYNSIADLRALLDSLATAQTETTLEVLVVDNASSDGTPAEVRASAPWVTVIELPRNAGYAAAINVASRSFSAQAPLLVLNADVELPRGAVQGLLLEQRRLDAGILVPRLVDGDGDLSYSVRREPTVVRAFCDALLGSRLRRRPSWASEVDLDARSYDRPRRVDWATGAAMLISTACQEAVGQWDERFFLYSEETDYCRRARQSGHTIVFSPAVTVTHRGAGSGTSPRLEALMTINRWRYHRKHHGVLSAGMMRSVLVLGALLRSRQAGARESLRCLRSAKRCDALLHPHHAGGTPDSS